MLLKAKEDENNEMDPDETDSLNQTSLTDCKVIVKSVGKDRGNPNFYETKKYWHPYLMNTIEMRSL